VVVVRPTAVTIGGPTQGAPNVTYTFTATVSPASATKPITYTWVPTPGSGQGTATATHSWTLVATHTIVVTAANAGGFATDIHTLAIAPQRIHLPVILR
jgi:PKD domain